MSTKNLFILLLLSAVCVYAAVTEVHTTGTKSTDYTNHKNTAQNYSTLKKVSVTFANADIGAGATTETLDSIYGIVLRIVIDETGGDADFDVLLRDESDITIFSKTGLAADAAYAVYEDDTEGNPWGGVPVGGAVDLLVTDAGDSTALTVHIYYLDFWK